MGNERCYAYFKILSFMGCIRGIFYEWFHSKFFWIHWFLSNSNNNNTQPLTEKIYKTESLPIKHLSNNPFKAISFQLINLDTLSLLTDCPKRINFEFYDQILPNRSKLPQTLRVQSFYKKDQTFWLKPVRSSELIKGSVFCVWKWRRGGEQKAKSSI